ncbi:MauE/DoxX family redox-associated membrane protein [Halobaculum sp. MBLA0143]|uniref:DoxX family protein n=1 Tax=Halobaculum sp. MBLA0143 TaxID=3079933 RepID=UPI00352386D1
MQLPLDTDELDTVDRLSLVAMASLYLVAGVAHFLAPEPFERIVPPWLPRPRALVYVSGAAEVAVGLGVLHPRTRRASAVGLALLLAAVFPANVYMAAGDPDLGLPGTVGEPSDAALWGRLPLQAALVVWALRYARDDEEE